MFNDNIFHSLPCLHSPMQATVYYSPTLMGPQKYNSLDCILKVPGEIKWLHISAGPYSLVNYDVTLIEGCSVTFLIESSGPFITQELSGCPKL